MFRCRLLASEGDPPSKDDRAGPSGRRNLDLRARCRRAEVRALGRHSVACLQPYRGIVDVNYRFEVVRRERQGLDRSSPVTDVAGPEGEARAATKRMP